MEYRILEIFLIFVFPVLLWYFGVIPVKYRYRTFAIMNLAALVVVFIEKRNLEQLGIRLDNLNSSLFPYTVFTILSALVLYTVIKVSKREIVDEWRTNHHFYYGFILISISQEFLYRGFLIPSLDSLFNPFIAVIANAILFSLIHLIYPELKIDLPLIFMAGIAFATIYYFYPNLILISLSHMVLNYMATMFGFFSFYKPKKAG